MKRSMYFMGLLLLAGSMVFTACKKDDDPTPAPPDNTPVLTFIGGAGYTDADAEMTTGSTFKVGINAAENANTNKNIESFVVVRTFNNVSTTVFEENNIGEPNYTWEDDLLANAAAGDERWTFTVTDKDDYTKELSIVITTIPIVTIVAYTDLDMGSWNDPNFGSFMATATGTVMIKPEAELNQASVDFAFYLGDANGSTFGAPSNSDVQDIFDLEGVWTIFNTTLFEMAGISGADFDAIGGTYTFPEFTSTKDDINDLSNGDVVYFKTKNDKLGFIKVNAINGKGDVVNIDMKVMQ
ncbi:MAG: hypothetical protein K8R63_00135 [Bacteroidales bacterium]|nr:hypothetical protein [Bacteroidales bacterium]